jgi:hypothetical protein
MFDKEKIRMTDSPQTVSVLGGDQGDQAPQHILP